MRFFQGEQSLGRNGDVTSARVLRVPASHSQQGAMESRDLCGFRPQFNESVIR